jgi:hypothetical protein
MDGSFRRVKIVVKVLLGLRPAVLSFFSVAILCCFGCGQGGAGGGQVLHATGFFNAASSGGSSPATRTVDSGRTVSFSQTISIPNDLNGDGIPDGCFIGLENLQSSSAVITSGANLTYTISGSNFSVPDDFFPFSISLPPTGSTGPTQVFAQVQVVSPATMDFLRANSASLPPPPFEMTVAVAVLGQSQAGGNFASTPIAYTVTFTD